MTSLHPSLDPRIFFREALAARDAGYEVAVIGNADKSFEYEGICVNALSNGNSGALRFLTRSYQVLKKALEERADIYQFHDFELIVVAVLLRLMGKTVVYDVHEDLPRDVRNKPYIPRVLMPLVSRLVAFVEFCACYLVSGIVAATPTIALRFPKTKTVCVRNYPALDSYVEVERRGASLAGRAIYVGGISSVRGVDTMLAAGEKLAAVRPYSLVLAGGCRPVSLETKLAQTDFVEYAGSVPPDQIPALLGTAEVGIVLLAPFQSYVDALPLKLFEYMAAGLPVVASNFGVMQKIVSDEKCGILVEPGDEEGLREAQSYLFDHPAEARAMGDRGRAAVERCYNWENEASALTGFYAQWS